MIKIKYLKEITFAYAICISLFHFGINIWGGISDLWFNSAHFALLASLGFLTHTSIKNENEVSIFNLLFAVMALGTFAYMVGFEESLYAVSNGQMRTSDLIVAGMTIALAVEVVVNKLLTLGLATSVALVGIFIWYLLPISKDISSD